MTQNTEVIKAQFEAHLATTKTCLDSMTDQIDASAERIVDCLNSGGKVVAFGNGGSAAQADHLVGELVGRFQYTRRPLPAICLAGSPGVVTCIANDFGYDDVFARQIDALVKPQDLAIGLTTSGQSQNVLRGLLASKVAGAGSIALLGGAALNATAAEIEIRVPSTSTARIQEMHLLIIHIWCTIVDRAFGGD